MALTPEELAALRQEYSLHGLHRTALDPDPIVQFNRWLADAFQQGILEPNAMILATVDAEGRPMTRTVLLKTCDPRGFTFFTNYRSAKARALEANPRCALTFWWDKLQRQVNITGTASRTSREESELYFATRPRGSQVGAWASEQSTDVEDRAQLERQFADALARFEGQAIPCPPHWGGFCVAPETLEFWQGRQSRLHDRLRFTRSRDGGWQIERLSP